MTLTSDTVHIGLSTSIQRAEVDVAAGVILHPYVLSRVEYMKILCKAKKAHWIHMTALLGCSTVSMISIAMAAKVLFRLIAFPPR